MNTFFCADVYEEDEYDEYKILVSGKEVSITGVAKYL